MMGSDIFISYASVDLTRAKLWAAEFERRGFSVWWDRTIPPGKRFDVVIEQALEDATCVVVLWSEASVQSDWVINEAAAAMDRGILLPVLMDDVKIPFQFRRLQAASLVAWDGGTDNPQFTSLLRAITSIVGPKTEESVSRASDAVHNSREPESRAETAGSPLPGKESLDESSISPRGESLIKRIALGGLLVSLGSAVSVMVGMGVATAISSRMGWGTGSLLIMGLLPGLGYGLVNLAALNKWAGPMPLNDALRVTFGWAGATAVSFLIAGWLGSALGLSHGDWLGFQYRIDHGWNVVVTIAFAVAGALGGLISAKHSRNPNMRKNVIIVSGWAFGMIAGVGLSTITGWGFGYFIAGGVDWVNEVMPEWFMTFAEVGAASGAIGGTTMCWQLAVGRNVG